jgi:hypothetical protein
MPISHKYKCIFIHIPKVGGVSIEHALSMIDDQTDRTIENRDILYGRIDNSSSDLRTQGFISQVLQHLRIRDLNKILPIHIINQYVKFAFVRNPWDRMVSLYHYEALICSRSSHKGHRMPSFAEFLENLDPFLRQEQYSFIIDENGENKADFIGRFENLNQDFKNLCKKIKCPHSRLPFKNAVGHKPYYLYYTDITREIVAELFQNDIKMFGYKFEELNLIDRMKYKIQRVYNFNR